MRVCVLGVLGVLYLLVNVLQTSEANLVYDVYVQLCCIDVGVFCVCMCGCAE